MALQVWLPLNGNLDNQGVSNLSFTNNNLTFSDSGKIGKAGDFNGSNYAESTTTFGEGITTWSIATWIKPSSTTLTSGAWYRIGGVGDHIRVHIDVTSDNKVRMFVSLDGTARTYKNATSTTVLQADKWYHVCGTVDDASVKMYINGTLESDSLNSTAVTSTLAGKVRVGTINNGNRFVGMINDFRIYDHALSPKEVKLISQGLVLHYPLNRDGFGGDNIIPGTSATEIQYTYPSTGYNDKFSATTSIVPSASQYVASFWAKSTVNGDKVRMHWYSPNTTTRCESSQGVVTTAADGNIDITLSTEWKYYWVVYTQSSTTAVKHFIFPRMFSQERSEAAKGTGTVSVKCLKVEEGNVPTPWGPNSNDATYASMAVSSNVISDASGYSYNGTTGGTIIYIADTPRYSVATNFAENTSTATITPCFSSGQQITEMSVSCWFKTNTLNSTAPNVFSLGENSFFRSRLGNATSIWYYIRVGSTQCSNTFAAGKTLTDNTWHLLVVTASSGVIKVYVDGVLIGTGDHSATAKYLTCSNVGTTWHLAGYTANSENFIGSLSDFRIYATALSADDVQKLYRSFASVTGNGSLLTYSFSEL